MRAALILLLITGMAQAATIPDERLVETRYCGAPARDKDGSISRSASVLVAFKKLHPCPANRMTAGACPGWAIDHVIPLACGGCDAVRNLQWLKNEIKSCPGLTCKDRWERLVYETDIPCGGGRK